MDSASVTDSCRGLQELVGQAENEAHDIADALGFLAQSVEDMNHNDREWSVGALVGFLRAVEKKARDLGTYMDEEGAARRPKPTAEERATQDQQDAAASVWGDGMRAIYQHPELAGEVADALKTILGKVPTKGHEEVAHA